MKGQHYAKWEQNPTKVKAWDKDRQPTEVVFEHPKWGRYGRAYWRLMAAFNPDLPGAEKVDDSEIGSLLIDLIAGRWGKPNREEIKDDLRRIITGDLS